jgi:carboxyl-terminal processing protease
VRKSVQDQLSLRSCALALLLCFAVAAPSFAQAVGSRGVNTLAREGRLAVFDDVWQTINARYYDPNFHGVDWQAQRAAFRPLAAEAQSAAEFYAVLRGMLRNLQDAHTRVYAPDERFDWHRPRFISVGLSVREVAGQPVVVQVERGSEAERAGLRVGDTINSIDGRSALNLFAHKLKEQAGSSTPAAARFRAMAMIFEGSRDSIVSVVWTDNKGKERQASLRREWRERDTSLHVRSVGSGYALVQLNAFTPEAAQEFLRLMRGRLREARGLVLDLRSNGGGEAEVMTELASLFLPPGRSLGQFIDRQGRVAFVPQTRTNFIFTAEPLIRFQHPLVILTSERTSSAAEIFVAAMTEARRAYIVGGPTCGCVLAIRRRHTLPDGGELYVSEMDYRTATGTRLEGRGLTPDESVTLDCQDLRAHRDRTIDRAIEQLKSMSEER